MAIKISADELEALASKEVAKGLLPELIRRLIRATADKIEDVYFPSGESTFRPGADGVLRAGGKPPFVPDGVSIWELSTEKRPHEKGKRDIDKRSRADAQNTYLDVARSEITYVAVSLRRWHGEKNQDRAGFESAQQACGVWKEVKVLDVEHLEDWLDSSPAVSVWLARKLHTVSEDMKSIEDFWEDYRTGITPPMSPELLLLDRAEKAKELIEQAVQGNVFRVKADSPDEAAAFIGASLLSLPLEDPRRDALLAKGVVIKNPGDEAFINATTQKLFIVCVGRATDIATRLAAKGHTVAAVYGNSHTTLGTNSPLIDLRRPKRQGFAQALQAMGMDEATARITAGECHCSITVLYRIRDLAHSRRPNWATPQQLDSLLGPILSGAWMHLSDADAEVVAELADVSRSDVERWVKEVLGVDDAPILRAGSLTALSAPADIWQLSMEAGVISRPVLDRFRAAVIKVLGERDPSLDLPLERRVYASIEGKERAYSGALRRGLTEILRLIAINDDKLRHLDGGFSAQHFVDGIFRDLPNLHGSFETLASLDPLLADLAEAAPDPFLSALETLSAGDGSKLSPIFEGSEDSMFGRTYYLGMLRGLEVLAWDPTLLSRATQILARLSEIDPGGRLTNRPINSLAQIFLPWRPHTNAPQQARHQTLTHLCQRYPGIAWDLLAKLLPVRHGISFGTAEPEWREMSASQRPVPTNASVSRDWAFVIDLATPLAGTEPERWISLLDAAAMLGDERLLDRMLASIEAQHAAIVANAHDDRLWEALSGLAAKHRSFADEDWAMPSSMVEKIERVASPFRPLDLVALYRPLFDHISVERLNPDETSEQRRERADRERDQAVSELLANGIDAVVDLARQAKTPGLIAASIVRTGGPDSVRDFVLATFNLDDQMAWLAGLVVAQATSKLGFAWGAGTIEAMEAHGASEQRIAGALALWDDSTELRGLVASKPPEVQSSYWASRDTWVRTDDETLVVDTISQLIEHGRSPELMQFIGSRRGKTDTATLMKLLAQAFDAVIADPARVRQVDGYWLREIFEELRDREGVDGDALMGLEYRWFPLLHSYGEPQVFALHRYMGERPEFFIQVLSDLYRADNEVETEEQPEGVDASNYEAEESSIDDSVPEADANARARADIAYKLLESWQTLPWTTDDGSIDYPRMRDWVLEAWRLARDAGRLGVAEREVGKLLAYSVNDPIDGVWPQREVRDLIEELANPEMESAIVVELFNKRGVHSRPPEGGGGPERELAKRAAENADKLANGWPRTSRVLRNSQKDWLYHGQREDRRAAEKRISL